MNKQLELVNTCSPTAPAGSPSTAEAKEGRQVMNGKTVFTREAKTVINFESNFSYKLLCDGPTFSAGDACVYSCAFCYVPDLVRKLRAIPQFDHVKGKHEEIVIRRGRAAEIARQQLTDRYGAPKYKRPAKAGTPNAHLHGPAVIYSSPLVDVAGNMELVRETIEICRTILELTNWQIRLLSKSNLLPKIAESISREYSTRVIYGVSTGTLDDGLAKAFEAGTPLVSKRIQSLHWLQDNGFRTYGMVCPSLPVPDYRKFAREAAAAIRADRCEHIWAEVINLRGESFTRTLKALRAAKLDQEAEAVDRVMTSKELWENYARETFNAHAAVVPKGKLRFLQYVKPATEAWWQSQKGKGAIVL